MIDLRSDTVTQPTDQMRQAMADAEVGDAVIDIDPTMERLEKMTAKLLGKEDAAFMPSGSMANQIAVRVHCDRGSEFICEADCHIYHYEQGAFAQLSGLVARTVAGEDGVLQLDQLAGLIRPDNEHFVRTSLVCLENTHNRWGGRIQPHEEVIQICDWARENGLKSHLDGARLWNASVATGLCTSELSKPFDSVSVCFSKGLGAPVGSAVAGSAEFVREARRTRKLFGGAMRQVGIIAAGAIHALENHRGLLESDHVHAQQLADACQLCDSLSIRGGRIDTNIVICDIDPEWGTAQQLVDLLAENDIRCFPIGEQAIRLVTHFNVSEQQVERACEIIQSLASASMAEST
jgi:threonine aldolase